MSGLIKVARLSGIEIVGWQHVERAREMAHRAQAGMSA